MLATGRLEDREMDWLNAGDGLELDNDEVFDKQVESMCPDLHCPVQDNYFLAGRSLLVFLASSLNHACDAAMQNHASV